ncbi:MAG: hypothetical protein RL208_367 [Pseudomonadota bacterium]|jgi:ankyrin repeat protein
MVHRFFVFLFLSGLCLTVSFAVDKFIPIGNQEFINNKTQIVNEMQEAKEVIISGDDKESKNIDNATQINYNDSIAIVKKNKNENFFPRKRKRQGIDNTDLPSSLNQKNDPIYESKLNSSNELEKENILNNNLNYIQKTLPSNAQNEKNASMSIQTNYTQNDDDFINNDINKLTYKLSQNSSNSKLAKAIISKIASTLHEANVENDIDLAKLDKIYLAKEDDKTIIAINENAIKQNDQSIPLVEKVAFASKNSSPFDNKINNITPIQPNIINNNNLLAIADDDIQNQQSAPTLVDRVSKLNQKTSNAVKKTKQSFTSIFKKDPNKANINNLPKLELDDESINQSKTQTNSTPEQKRNKRFATQVSPPNISQKIYNLENKHLTPAVFDEDIIQNAFNQPNSEQGVENIKSIVRKFGYNIKDENGNTILMHAVAMRNYDLIHFLVNNGANPNITNNEGFNVLHLVTSNNDYDSLYEIVSYSKIDCEMQDSEGNTPLIYAVSVGDLKILKLLHLNGCGNFDFKNKNGLTLVDFAKQNQDPLVMDYVISNNVNHTKQQTSDSINLNKKYNNKGKNGKL